MLFSASTIWIVEQFGLAIILSFFERRFALISGTTNLILESILQADELSMTVVPAFANNGAHCFEIFPPAEKIAILGLFSSAFSILTIMIFEPLKETDFPTLFLDATTNNSSIGKFLSSNILSRTFPTIPVAPTKANFIKIF